MNVIISCEHGGARVPRAYRALFAEAGDDLASHRGWDPGALVLARALAGLIDAPLIAATTSRLVIDLNRSLSHPRSLSAYTRGLDPSARAQLIARHYRPYRDETERAIAAAVRRGGAVHLSVHTFVPVLDGRVRDVDLGLLYDPRRATERVHCDRWARQLRGMLPDLRVRRNAPYRGDADGFTTALRRVHPDSAYLGIEIELNQARVEQRGEVARIARALATTLHGVIRMRCA